MRYGYTVCYFTMLVAECIIHSACIFMYQHIIWCAFMFTNSPLLICHWEFVMRVQFVAISFCVRCLEPAFIVFYCSNRESPHMNCSAPSSVNTILVVKSIVSFSYSKATLSLLVSDVLVLIKTGCR